MDFEQRLQRAINRGVDRSDDKARKERDEKISEEEFRRLHGEHRLQLAEHIEQCVQKLSSHFPGFRYETIYGDKGWGAACYRDDVAVGRRGRDNFYSRLEMTIRPLSSVHVLDLAAKATIRNKEVFKRNHFEALTNLDADQFIEFVDVWVLEYAELYAARS